MNGGVQGCENKRTLREIPYIAVVLAVTINPVQ